MKPLASILPVALSLFALGGLYVEHRRVTSLESQLVSARDAPAPEEGAHDPNAGDLALLRARVDRLDRVTAAGPAPQAGLAGPIPAAATGAVAAPPPADIHQLRQEVDALLTGEATATEQGKARLKAILEESQREQWREREQRRDDRILSRIGESAPLSDRQREDLGKAMEAERTQRRVLMESARTGGADYDQLRPLIEALRAETDRKAKEILGSDQLAQYEAARAQARPPRAGAGSGAPETLGQRGTTAAGR